MIINKKIGNDFLLLAFYALVIVVSSYGPHHPKGPHSHYKPQTGSNLMKDTKLIQDEVHIREDLSNFVANPETHKMSPAELEFHYFKIHDFDNNKKLDGLEILQAIRHTLHNDEGDNPEKEFQHYIDLIDRVLEEDDLDRDGYLSYVEYVVGREREKKVSKMEQSDCTEQEIETKNGESESVSQSDSITCNGFADDESSKAGLKRKFQTLDSEENEKKYVKLEDHGGGDIPAHHARRPPNGFLLFCKRHRDIVSAKNPNLENRGVTKLLGNWWRTLEEEERGKYKELARLNKEVFIANNPQFTWYKLPAPPLRTLVTRPSNRRPPKLETSPINPAGPITPGKLADESQLGGLTNLLSSSVSPPSTPFNASPPSPTSTAPAHPKKRFLLQTRAKQSDGANSLSESEDGSDNNKSIYKAGKKSYRKKKSLNSLKYKRNLKMKWSDSFSGKLCLDTEPNDRVNHTWKTDNGSPNCTQQQLIEKVVDSSFESQKPMQNFDIQRKLDYINTEHTYQKNPGRFWQQKQKIKKESCVPLQIVGKLDGLEQNIISPNVNNNTILIKDGEANVKIENGLNDINYSYNDTKLISDYLDDNQRQLDQSSIQTNHDRIIGSNIAVGYIPDKYAREEEEEDDDEDEEDDDEEDCDKMGGLEDQKKPLKVTQDDDIPKNCDRESNFQSILGKVSREIGNMINERSPESTEEMAVAKFNIQSRSESDSDESYDDKSDTASPPESPGGGRRSKRSCKGQRYEQFIKDSVSKKRTKNSEIYSSIEYRKSKKKRDMANPSSDELEVVNSYDRKENESEEQGDGSEAGKDATDSCNNQLNEDLTVKQGTKASDIIKMKLEKESRMKRDGDESIGKKQKESRIKLKKKPMSKVQMIKERREVHIGEFNLNEKIEELPLLSFESFLQKKRQRKKRLLGLKKESMKNRAAKNKFDKHKNRDSRINPNGDGNVPNKSSGTGQNVTKPDFTNLTTLAETALTLLSLSEPRNMTNEEN